MLLVIDGRERQKYKSELNQYFKARYDHFIVRRQWSLPSRDGLEVDQYDNDGAVYFLLMNSLGLLESAARINPTMQSSLLADCFPHLIETGEPLRSQHLYEGTRYIINPAMRQPDTIRRSKAVILSALVEWCLKHRVKEFQAIIDSYALSSFLKISMETRILGLAHEFGGGKNVPGGGECLAFRWKIGRRLLDDILAYGELQGPVLEQAAEPAIVSELI